MRPVSICNGILSYPMPGGNALQPRRLSPAPEKIADIAGPIKSIGAAPGIQGIRLIATIHSNIRIKTLLPLDRNNTLGTPTFASDRHGPGLPTGMEVIIAGTCLTPASRVQWCPRG